MASNVLKELVELIGFQPTLAITRAYGGRTLRVPSHPNPAHPLATIIGQQAVEALCREYGGVHIDVPTERTALIEQRNTRIREEIAAGAKVLPTARRYGLSPKMVRIILGQRGVETATVPLTTGAPQR
jgi:hypothetical protein